MTAVIYARYSTDSQREESIEGQIRECTAYAEKNGFTVVKHYIDRAVSAKTDNRPQFQQMIKDSERGIFDVIIVWKLDRFARNRYDSARYKTQLKRNGVKLVSATEVISAGPEGIILESVLEGYAEYYSADLSEKVVRGMTENALKGIYNGGTIPFGYMIDETRHYQPDPLLAPYVEQTFQKYADGATMTDLRDWLKAHNIKNSMGGEIQKLQVGTASPCLLRSQMRKFLSRKITAHFKLNLKADGPDCKMIFKFGKHVERFHSIRKQCRRIYICTFCVAKHLLENPNPFPICTVPVQARHLSTQRLWF